VTGDVAIEMPSPALPTSGASVHRLDPTSDGNWDADVATCDGATFFHGSSWARVLKDAYGFNPVYFAVRHSGQMQALLPMMDVDSWITGRRGVSLPFTDECAPLCSSPDSFKGVYQEALDYAKARRWKYIECRGGLRMFENASPSISFLGHRLDLRGGEAALFARCESRVRRAVRKAEQSDLTIEFSQELGALCTFHGLLCKTRRRHGVPPQPFEFFRAIHRNVLEKNQGWVVLARIGKTPVAGAVYFHFCKTVTFKYGASDETFQHLRANNLVMWEAIKRFARDDFEILDFGRTSLTNGGLRNYKLSWGTVEHPIEYVRYDCRTGRFAMVQDKSSGFETQVLRLLPDPVFNWVGSALYKHVA
jgi:hypothetical protein